MGMFMDDASHAVDWLFWMLGEPVSVMAEIDNVLTDHSPDDTGIAIYRFPGGEMGCIFNSSVVWAGENTVEIYGDRGVLVENYGDGPSNAVLPPHPIYLKYYDAQNGEAGWQDMQQWLPPGQGWRIQNVIRNMLDEYRAGKVQCSAREGKVSTAMILGAYESAAEGGGWPCRWGEDVCNKRRGQIDLEWEGLSSPDGSSHLHRGRGSKSPSHSLLNSGSDPGQTNQQRHR